MKLSWLTLVLGSCALAVSAMQPALGQEGGGKSAAKNTANQVPILVGENIVQQVEDVRETIGDLVNAIENGGQNLAFTDWNKTKRELDAMQAKLSDMEKSLQRKEDMTQEDLSLFYNSPEWKVSVNNTVSELGNMLATLGKTLEVRK